MYSQGTAGSLNAELMISHLKGVQGLNLSPTGRYPDVLREPHCLYEEKKVVMCQTSSVTLNMDTNLHDWFKQKHDWVVIYVFIG